MSKPKITEEEKEKLRDSAKAELERLEAICSNEEVTQLLNDFKGKYNLCESVYKVVLVKYQKTKGRKPKEYLAVDGRQVEAALKFAGYNFDKALLTEIFGAKSQKGKTVHTVKKLRDAVTHSIDSKAVQEITDRKQELFGYMDAFLSGIRDFDAAACPIS